MLNIALDTAKSAGHLILKHYGSKQFKSKQDHSPVTPADLESSRFIVERLTTHSRLPVLSEEQVVPYNDRKAWTTFWLVDPLDGTRDFLLGTDEFTVNIALVSDGVPCLGVIYAPALDICWWGELTRGSFRNGQRISPPTTRDRLIATESRHHSSQDTKNFLEHHHITKVQRHGSALKFGLLAEGTVDVYPRLHGTKEWDTAAAEPICREAGCLIRSWPDNKPLTYNKENLSNPFFIASRNTFKWSQN